MSYLIVFQTCIKYTIIINYPIPTVITEYIFIWDRLFGTFRTLPKEEIVYGIDTHMKNENTMN
jgi:hypothetical protein